MDTVSQTQSRDPYERLLCAVLVSAWKDAHGRNEYERAKALEWLRSDGAVNICELLGLPVDRLRRRLDSGDYCNSWNLGSD